MTSSDHEATVRRAANALADAIDRAQRAGYTVVFDSRLESLRSIQISETSQSAVTVNVTVPPEVDPEVAAKAQAAGVAAATRVVGKAE